MILPTSSSLDELAILSLNTWKRNWPSLNGESISFSTWFWSSGKSQWKTWPFQEKMNLWSRDRKGCSVTPSPRRQRTLLASLISMSELESFLPLILCSDELKKSGPDGRRRERGKDFRQLKNFFTFSSRCLLTASYLVERLLQKGESRLYLRVLWLLCHELALL